MHLISWSTYYTGNCFPGFTNFIDRILCETFLFFLMHLFLLNLKVHTVALFENSPKKARKGKFYSYTSTTSYGFITSIHCCYCSVTKSCPLLSDPMNCSMPGFPVFHHLMKFAQIQVHWVSDAIWPSHPLLLPSPLAFNISQHQGLFIMVSQINWEDFHFKWVRIRQKIFCPYACETECIWK